MKLIYANIIRYRNIFDQEIYFSNQYRISYDRKKGFPEGLLIRKINPDSIASIVYENSMLKQGCMLITIPKHEPIKKVYVEMVRQIVESEAKNDEDAE